MANRHRKNPIEIERRLIVIAPNAEWARHWCNERGISPFSKRVTISVSVRTLLGWAGPLAIVFVGPWYERRDASQIDAQVRFLKRKVDVKVWSEADWDALMSQDCDPRCDDDDVTREESDSEEPTTRVDTIQTLGKLF